MESASEKMLKAFVDLCETLVSEAYVITDGRSVLTATLDHAVASKLCDMMIKQSNNKNWKVATLNGLAQYAFKNGYAAGKEASTDGLVPDLRGDTDGKDSELREREIQHEEESD